MTRTRDFLLLTFLVSLVLRNVQIGPTSVTQLLLILIFPIGLLLAVVSKRGARRKTLQLIGIWVTLPAIFWMADVASAMVHDTPTVSDPVLKARIGSFVAYMLPFLLLTPTISLERCNRAIVMAATISALTIIFTAFGIFDFAAFGGRTNTTEFANFAGEALPRTSGILSDFGDIAILLSFAMPWITLVPRKLKQQIAIAPVVAVLLLGAFLPLSRNVWLVVAFTQFLSLLFYVRLNGGRHAIKASLISIAMVLAVALFLIYAQELIDVLIAMREASSDARIIQYEGFLRTFPEHFLFGSGVDRCVFGGDPIHNAIVLSACRTGLIGSIPFTLLYVLNFVALGRAALRARRIPDLGERMGTVSLFISFTGFAIATMLFPGGADNASQIYWGLFGLFSATSIRQLGSRATARMLAAPQSQAPNAAPRPSTNLCPSRR